LQYVTVSEVLVLVLVLVSQVLVIVLASLVLVLVMVLADLVLDLVPVLACPVLVNIIEKPVSFFLQSTYTVSRARCADALSC